MAFHNGEKRSQFTYCIVVKYIVILFFARLPTANVRGGSNKVAAGCDGVDGVDGVDGAVSGRFS